MKKTFRFIIAIICIFMIQLNQVVAFNNVSNSATLKCGPTQNGSYLIKDIPQIAVKLVHFAYIVIQVAVPVVLVIFGMIDMIKAITAGKEDEIKKAQGVLIRRIIYGVLVFFIFAIVKLVVNFAGADRNVNRIVDCMNCFLNDSCS